MHTIKPFMNILKLSFVSLLAIATGWYFYNKYRVVIPPVDVSKSEIGWSATSLSGAHTGKIKLSKAELQFKNDVLVGGMFEADMRSITVTDITDPEENKQLVKHISDQDFFEVEKYPTATFKITEVTRTKDDTYEVKGMMKIKDKENPVSFTTRIEKNTTSTRAAASVTVDRTLYGIEYGAKGKPGSEKDWFIFNDFLLNINVVAAGS